MDEKVNIAKMFKSFKMWIYLKTGDRAEFSTLENIDVFKVKWTYSFSNIKLFSISEGRQI